MLDDIRKAVESSLDAFAKQAPEQLTSAVSGRAERAAEQLFAAAAGFLQWSAAAREGVAREVRDLVSRQVSEMGLASRRDLEALAKRVARIEAGGASERAAPRGAAAGTRSSKAVGRKGGGAKKTSARQAGAEPAGPGRIEAVQVRVSPAKAGAPGEAVPTD